MQDSTTTASTPEPIAAVALSVEEPVDRAEFETPDITVTGSTEPGAQVKITIGTNVFQVTPEADGAFYLPLLLPGEGTHQLTVSATKEGVEPSTITRTVRLTHVAVEAPTEPPALPTGIEDGGAEAVQSQAVEVLSKWADAITNTHLGPRSGPFDGPAAIFVQVEAEKIRAGYECQPEWTDCSYLSELGKSWATAEVIVPLGEVREENGLYRVDGLIRVVTLNLTNLAFRVEDGQAVFVTADIYTTGDTKVSDMTQQPPEALGRPVPMERLSGYGGMTSDGMEFSGLAWAAYPRLNSADALLVRVSGTVTSVNRQIGFRTFSDGTDGILAVDESAPEDVRTRVRQLHKALPVERLYQPGESGRAILVEYFATSQTLQYSATTTFNGVLFTFTAK